MRWLYRLAISCFFLSLPAYASDRETLGEYCYDILHGAQPVDEMLKAECLSKLKQSPVIVITPTRREQDIREAPAAVAVIQEEELKRAGGDSVAEVVRDVPGVEITDAGEAGHKRIRIRGEDSRRVAILIDGQEFADQREVGTPLLIAPEMIERVEVVRGTGSVLHGSQAIGGVVNFITKKKGYHPIQGTVSSLFDSSTNGYQLYSSLYGAHDGYGYRLSGLLGEADDRETPDGELDNTSYENDSFSAYISKDWGNHTVGLSYDDYNSSSEVFVDPVVATTPPLLDFQIDVPIRDRSKAAMFFDSTDLSNTITKLHVDTYYQESERQFNTFSEVRIEIPEMEPLVRSTDIFTHSVLATVGGNAQIDLDLSSAHHLIIGLEAKNDELNQERDREVTTARVSSPLETVIDDAAQAAIEPFIEDSWSLSEDWVLRGGVRGYWVETDLEETTRVGLTPDSNSDRHAVGSVGLQFLGIENTNFWTGWSQGFVFPTLVNLATGAFAGPNYVNPNPDLDPETSNSVELGMRFDDGKFLLDTAFFYTLAEDYIDHIACAETAAACIEPGGARDRVYVNISEAKTFGIELVTEAHLGLITPYLNATWLRRRFDTGQRSTYETGLADISGRAGFLAEEEFSSMLTGWADFYIRCATDSDELDTSGQVIHKSGWGTLNVSLGIEAGAKRNYRLILELLNLGDKEYVTATENLTARGRSAIIKFVADV